MSWLTDFLILHICIYDLFNMKLFYYRYVLTVTHLVDPNILWPFVFNKWSYGLIFNGPPRQVFPIIWPKCELLHHQIFIKLIYVKFTALLN